MTKNKFLHIALASIALFSLSIIAGNALAAEVILSTATNPPLTGTSGAVSTNATITTANDEEALRINAQVDLTVTAGTISPAPMLAVEPLMASTLTSRVAADRISVSQLMQAPKCLITA